MKQASLQHQKNYGINLSQGKIRIIDISPVVLNKQPWLCIGFEPVDKHMGDFFHLALIHTSNLDSNAFDLVREAKKQFTNRKAVIRIHSECVLGDVFGSSLCDCGEQLEKSMEMIVNHEGGIVIYLRQEGRGIGLRAKLSCLAIQSGYLNGKKTERPHSSDEANMVLGFGIDEREYSLVSPILTFLAVREVISITGNPDKIKTLDDTVERVETMDIPRLTNISQRCEAEILEKIARNYHYSNFKPDEKTEGNI